MNGGCGEICVPDENGPRCECNIGQQLQADQSCASGMYSYYIYVIYHDWFGCLHGIDCLIYVATGFFHFWKIYKLLLLT